MNEYWEKFSVFVNEKTLRERVIILLMLIVIVYGLCDLLFMGALLDKQAQKSKQLVGLTESNIVAERELADMMAVLQGGRESARREQQQLADKLAAVDAELASEASGFVPANLMPRVLEEMLEDTADLSLLKLENKPVELITGDSGGELSATPSRDEDSTHLYRHGVEMRLQGSYLAALNYLKRLEQLQWRFQWHALQFDIQEYPTGTVSVEVYTYSTERDWLGV